MSARWWAETGCGKGRVSSDHLISKHVERERDAYIEGPSKEKQCWASWVCTDSLGHRRRVIALSRKCELPQWDNSRKRAISMKDWIPLLQTLAWPVFVAILLYLFRDRFNELVQAIRSRIESGDPFEAGTSGIKLGSSSPRSPSGPEPRPGAQPLPDKPPSSVAAEAATTHGVVDERPISGTHQPSVYLVHTAKRDKSLDKGEFTYYSIRVFLEGEDDSDLDQVVKVIYHLHPTFYEPNRTEPSRTGGQILNSRPQRGGCSISERTCIRGTTLNH